jgi:hypothetical protein
MEPLVRNSLATNSGGGIMTDTNRACKEAVCVGLYQITKLRSVSARAVRQPGLPSQHRSTGLDADMADQITSQLLTLPVCPVCSTKMLVRGVFPIIYPNGRQDVTYNFCCDRCRIQSSQIGSVAELERPSVLAKDLRALQSTRPRKLKRAFG